MITTPPEMRAKTFDLSMSTWTLAAIGVLFETDLADQLASPRTLDELASAMPKPRLQRVLDLVATAGVIVADAGRYRLAEGAKPFVNQPMRASLTGDIRSQLMQPLSFLDAPAQPGWSHTDPRLLQAQGDASIAVPMMFKQMLVPSLGDLAARLDKPGARFLDVGVGVGAIAIGMCRTYPKLSVGGIDPNDHPLAIARDSVAKAGLADRIELRHAGVEALRDDAAFELAWLPAFFISPAVATDALARLHASLRPGGWIVLGVFFSPDARVQAVGSLVTDLWGGVSWTPAETEAQLARAGFSHVRVLPGPPGSPATMLVAQR